MDIFCVHTVERTRSIVNGRLMEWNSHLFVLSSYIHPPSFPRYLQPCVRIVKLLPAHCRCFPFMTPDMVDLIRVFFFLFPLFAVSPLGPYFFPFRSAFDLSSLFLNSGFKWRDTRSHYSITFFFLRIIKSRYRTYHIFPCFIYIQR